MNMFSSYTSGEYQSIVFFVDGHVDREMMYSEFEAILDNFVPVPGYAGKSIQGVSLGLNGQLKIISAVFFLLNFDSAGNADRKWNIPLFELAEQADPGPDLGAGPIKLCCRSQCSVEWHVQDLWDPDMSRQPNDFVLLRDLVRRNHLGLKELELDDDDIDDSRSVNSGKKLAPGEGFSDSDASDADKALAQSLITFIRKKVAMDNAELHEQQQREQQLLLAAQKNRFDDQLKETEQIHSDEIRVIQSHFSELQGQLEHEKLVAENLRKQLLDQQKITENLRESFHQQLAESKSVESNEIDSIKQNFESELELRIEAMASEFRQELEVHDSELAARDEQLALLREEIADLHAEHAHLIREAGEQFIGRLRDNRVTFMAYHLGVGNITIDLENIGTYLENPMSYAANICKVDEATYRGWLSHHSNPVCCEYSAAKGEMCGKKLRRVETPAQYIAGRSDRCPLHWSFIAESSQKPEGSSETT
jgi:hypothetical protein